MSVGVAAALDIAATMTLLISGWGMHCLFDVSFPIVFFFCVCVCVAGCGKVRVGDLIARRWYASTWTFLRIRCDWSTRNRHILDRRAIHGVCVYVIRR